MYKFDHYCLFIYYYIDIIRMEIFIGFILNDKIVSQKRYDFIINEIRHLLKAHSEEVVIHEDSTKL